MWCDIRKNRYQKVYEGTTEQAYRYKRGCWFVPAISYSKRWTVDSSYQIRLRLPTLTKSVRIVF